MQNLMKIVVTVALLFEKEEKYKKKKSIQLRVLPVE